MCSLCRLPVAKNHNFWQILTFGGSCTGPLLPMKVTFGVLKQTERLHLHAKFHLNVFILSAFGSQKPQFWANFDFGGGVSIGLFYCPLLQKTPIFAIFCTWAFSDVDSWRQSEKVEHGCNTNLPLSNGIKIISVLQRLHGEIGRTNSDVQKRDRQTKRDGQKSMTDRQKTQHFFATPVAGEIRDTANLVW